MRVIVHYHEIALKGRNRPYFVGRLGRNLRRATADLGVTSVTRLPGRLLLELGEETAWEVVRERLGEVFGVANFALAEETGRELEALKAAALARLEAAHPETFRVSARRADKRYPHTSPEVNTLVGAHLGDRTGIPVRLQGADLEVHLEILEDRALVYTRKIPGAGGLPVGVSGRVMALLSGGIDSPVAAARMMRRGCQVSFVHFHSHPFLDASSQEKARELAALLTRRQFRTRLYMVPFGEIQQEIVARGPAPLRVVLYRRQMVRIAEALAHRERALALCTGESVGQVASQTLSNLGVIDEVAKLPILRPLVGMDKEEISREGQALGTFPISIRPDQDCCTLFIPRQPATQTTVQAVRRAEELFDVAAQVEQGLAQADIEEIEFPPRSEGYSSSSSSSGSGTRSW